MEPSADSRRLWAQARRTVGGEITAVRSALLRVLRDLDYAIDTEQFVTVRASRGSQFGGATLSPARVPVTVTLTLAAGEAETTVEVLVQDRWRSPVGLQSAAAAAYRQVFDQVIVGIDAALSRLDPAAAAGFTRPIGNGGVAGSTGIVRRANQIENTLTRKSAGILDGKPAPGPGQLGRGEASGTGSADDIRVAITSPDKVARLDFASVYVMLTAGQLIASRPGKLPPELAKQVQQLVVTLEQRVDGSAPPPPFLQIPITAEQVSVVTFLRQQARLRDRLPLRTLQVCDTCRLEKVINPDFIQMRERSRRMKVLTGSFGAVITGRHISPYVLVGKLVQLKKSDPDFVCQRCQGLDADETIITFCPQCGERRSESVLRECPKCKLDYRTLLTPESIWNDIADVGDWGPSTQLSAPPVSAPPAQLAPAEWSAPPAQLAPMAATSIAPAWFADYSGRHELRYWDGQRWTAHVSDAGTTSTDPVQ